MRVWVLMLVPVVAWGGPVGTVTFSVNHQLAAALGVMVPDGTHVITTNTLTFNGADLESFRDGAISAGGLQLDAIPGTRRLQMSGGFTVENPHIGYHAGKVYIVNADLMYGRHSVAMVDIVADHATLPPPPGITPCTTNNAATYDVALTAIDNLQQRAREAGVRVSIAPSTKLFNVGTHDVPWLWSINPPRFAFAPQLGQHPYVIFNFYRLLDGVFVQIGRSDAKHAFYSTNEDCDCAGAQTIFTGCSDTYGVANNSDPYYFAPRNEINALAGTWTSLGSHFDAVPVDDFRNHTNEVDLFTHRLVVREADLTNTVAQYFIEAWYLVQNDTNIYNTMGYRRVTPLLTNSVWQFTTNTSLVNGPAMNAWPSRTNVAIDTGEGRVQLATATTNLGSGWFRYVFALANHDFERQLDSISLPVSPGVIFTNAACLDGDTNALNDWSFAVTNGSATWTAPTNNALDWGTLFSFRVDASAPPAGIDASLGIAETGIVDAVLAPSFAPVVPVTSVIPTGTGTAEIVWSTSSGSVYQVEATHDIHGAWLGVTEPVTAQSASLSVIDTNQTVTQRFYRVRLK